MRKINNSSGSWALHREYSISAGAVFDQGKPNFIQVVINSKLSANVFWMLNLRLDLTYRTTDVNNNLETILCWIMLNTVGKANLSEYQIEYQKNIKLNAQNLWIFSAWSCCALFSICQIKMLSHYSLTL